jgi:nucleoid-associated protein YgaU
MKQVRRVRSVLAPVLIFSMMAFLSCAHEGGTNSEDGGLFGDLMTTSTEGSTAKNEASDPADKPKDDAADLVDAKKTDSSELDALISDKAATPAEEKPKQGEEHADVMPGGENKDFDLPGGSSQGKIALVPATDTSDMKVEEAPKAEAPAEMSMPPLTAELPNGAPVQEMAKMDVKPEAAIEAKAPAADPLANMPIAEVPALMPEVAKVASVVEEAKKSEVAQAAEEKVVKDSMEVAEAMPVEPAEQAAAVSAKPRVASAIPRLPQQTVWRKGETLNRYYILRNGDSAEMVSNLIYGTVERAASLQAWNPSHWNTGSVVMYVSAEHPTDTSMKSFYEERGIEADQYVVQPGDWLSKIAANTYGDGQSWTEIAAMNHLESPDQIEAGATLKLYPTSLTVAANEKKAAMLVADNRDRMPVNPAPAEKPAVPAMNDVAGFEHPAIQSDGATAPKSVFNPDRKPSLEDESAGFAAPKKARGQKVASKRGSEDQLASPEVGGFFVQHLFATMAVLGAIVLAFVVLKRLRKPDGFELDE